MQAGEGKEREQNERQDQMVLKTVQKIISWSAGVAQSVGQNHAIGERGEGVIPGTEMAESP